MLEMASTLGGIAGFISFIYLIIRAIALWNTTKVERIFLSTEKNIIIKLIDLVLTSFASTILLIEYVFYKENIELTNILINDLIVLFLTAFIFSFFVFSSLFFILKMAFFKDKKATFYIEHDIYGKLFIIKSMDNDLVLLSNKQSIKYPTPDCFFLFENKDKPRLFIENQKLLENLDTTSFFDH